MRSCTFIFNSQGKHSPSDKQELDNSRYILQLVTRHLQKLTAFSLNEKKKKYSLNKKKIKLFTDSRQKWMKGECLKVTFWVEWKIWILRDKIFTGPFLFDYSTGKLEFNDFIESYGLLSRPEFHLLMISE